MKKHAKPVGVAPETESANDHLKEIVVNYVKEDSSNPYALMITGDWGCGKTHYLKKVLRKEIEGTLDKKMLYVSLNGVSSISDIYDQLLSEKYIALKFFKENKFARVSFKLIKSGVDVALRAFKIRSSSGNFDDLETEPGDLPSISGQELADFSKNIIVFDDLERISSKIGVTDILGFINTNFVEHDRIKVIVVSDEKKIEDVKFGKIKEKMIGRTLEFKPNVVEIVTTHIIGLPEGELKHFRNCLGGGNPKLKRYCR